MLDRSLTARDRWRRPRLGWLLVLLAGTTHCEREQHPEIELSVGNETPFRFRPQTALAHYYELVGQPDQLRLTLASYRVGCDDYEPPKKGEAFVTVVVRVPIGKTISPGRYPWRGSIDEVSEAPSALPFVRLGSEGRPLPAGGHLQLDELGRQRHEKVQAELHFASGDEEPGSQTILRGPVQARLCDVVLDSSRSQPEQ